MRMRQLASTQSVTFFAPPEVNQSILDANGLNHDFKGVNSSHVILWLLQQICISIEELQPLHYAQGVDCCMRTDTTLKNPNVFTVEKQRTNVLSVFRQTEHQTLQQVYGSRTQNRVENPSEYHSELRPYMNELEARCKGFQYIEGRSLTSAT